MMAWKLRITLVMTFVLHKVDFLKPAYFWQDFVGLNVLGLDNNLTIRQETCSFAKEVIVSVCMKDDDWGCVKSRFKEE